MPVSAWGRAKHHVLRSAREDRIILPIMSSDSVFPPRAVQHPISIQGVVTGMSIEETQPQRPTKKQLRAKFFPPIVGRESTELDVVSSDMGRRRRLQAAVDAKRAKEKEAERLAWEDYRNRYASEVQWHAAELQRNAIAAAAAKLENDITAPRLHTIADIQAAVCAHYHVSRIDLISHRRTADIVLPRQVAMYFAKLLTLRSMPEIARHFGGRDHTTVLHGVRKIVNRVAVDADFAAEIAAVKAVLEAE